MTTAPTRPDAHTASVDTDAPITDALLGVTTSVVAWVNDSFPTGSQVVRLGNAAADGTRMVGWDADPDRNNWTRAPFFPDRDALAESMRPGVLGITRTRHREVAGTRQARPGPGRRPS
ncbi:hypothetical protein OG948_36825 (plasmid) [Embleya sp. NBC_00888]|uniref:hypothetical protein n=1 Tax=Embleya sp. NBC_00888 TaxID=2975960 RepID=UPI002F9071F7|nr:hypothetical protein OG948_36825 [Embleya sp. NBC_00888]